MLENLKIAIVYDWIDKWGGVERILMVLKRLFPKAVFFTSYFNFETANWARKLEIQPSFMQNLPSIIKKDRLLSFPFFPYAFESFNFNEYQLVISVTSSFSKSIVTKPKTLHICYLLTPTRYLWLYPNLYIKKINKNLFSRYINHIKDWDYVSGQRPDHIISISETVANRCKKYYKRYSSVIYPPFDYNYWDKIKLSILNIKHPYLGIKKGERFFLAVSRLEPYKRIDLIINVFNKLGKKILIVGEGSQKNKLKKSAKNNIFFLSKLSDLYMGWLYTNSEALIMAQEEDFGYVSLEAQFFNCPVIAFNKGGVKETIIQGKTGFFFDCQSEESLSLAIERFHTISYNLKKNLLNIDKKNFEKFSIVSFSKKFTSFIISKLN